MREVRIDENGELENIHCPEAFGINIAEGDALFSCISSCALFSTKECEGLGGQRSTFLAFCKDTCIGRIKEPDNG